MKRFKFTLAPVEKVRERAEQLALGEVAAAQKALYDSIHKKNQLIEETEKALKRREMLGNITTSSSEYLLEDEYINGQKIRVLLQDRDIFRKQKEYEKVFRKYLTARKEKMKIEKLKEKRLEVFKKEQRKLESKHLDELYVMRAGIKQSEEEAA